MGKSWETIEKPNFIGRKYIDKSLFKYGIAIPAEYIPKFLDNIEGNNVDLGSSKYIKLIFDDYESECSLRNVDRKGVTSQTIQIRYDVKSELKEYLKNKFSYTYGLVENEEEIDTDEYIDIYKGNELNTFYIKEYTHNNLDQEAIDFINTIKKTRTDKSYKIPLLWAFYNNGHIKLKIDEDDIYNSFKEFYSKEENAKDLQNQKSTQGYENWGKKQWFKFVEDRPMKYLSEGTKEYFYKSGDLFCITDKIQPYIENESFINKFNQAIKSLELKYFSINYKELFIKWLEDYHELSKSSINKYASAVNTISNDFYNDKDYLYNISDLINLNNEINRILNDDKFKSKDSTGNKMYSNGLRKYFEFRNINQENKTIIDDNLIEESEEIISVEIINKVSTYIKNQGYNYTYNQLSNLYLSLKTKPFTILAGISGTGKSKIIRLLADSINADYTLISVRPDWNDATDLIGYKDLDHNFIKGQLTKSILKAKQNKNKIYFVCLDEMNLARVEYYLSDYLSIIESRKKAGQDIITDNIVEYQENNENISLHIPDNLYLIGTVNMDDTTFQFSRKVLDRANTIEFSDVDLDNLFFEINEDIESLKLSNNLLKTTYLKTMDIEEKYRDYAKEVNKKIIEINEILKKSQKQFAYRVRDEILFYLVENKKADLLDEDTAFDYQIMQKILPAINGSEQSVYQVLIDLLNFILETNDIETVEDAENYLETTTVKYENSAKKIIYMLKGYQNDGYVSYWY